MRDEYEIQDLISRYSDAITRREWSTVSSVFAAEATWQVLGERDSASMATRSGRASAALSNRQTT
jgi:hypothetical protein